MTEQYGLRPARLAHIGIQTHDIPAIRDWYCAMLNAHVVFEKLPYFCTLAYDEEHHRIAIASIPGKKRKKTPLNPELAHVAFAMADIQTLLLNYERLRDLGVRPTANLNHGATLSSYYLDPDGNQCELFVDCFPTMEQVTAWFSSPVYLHNFGGGVSFDPEDLLVRMRAGATDEELLHYPVEEGMKVDITSLLEEHIRAMAETET